LAWHEPSLPRFRRPKSALKFCVINYGLKSAAWLAFALPLPAHAIGFSQWLMTEFLSAEFIRRNLEGASLDVPKIFGRAGA